MEFPALSRTRLGNLPGLPREELENGEDRQPQQQAGRPDRGKACPGGQARLAPRLAFIEAAACC